MLVTVLQADGAEPTDPPTKYAVTETVLVEGVGVDLTFDAAAALKEPEGSLEERLFPVGRPPPPLEGGGVEER